MLQGSAGLYFLSKDPFENTSPMTKIVDLFLPTGVLKKYKTISRSIIFELKNRILLHCGEFTIGNSIVICPKGKDLLSDHDSEGKK